MEVLSVKHCNMFLLYTAVIQWFQHTGPGSPRCSKNLASNSEACSFCSWARVREPSCLDFDGNLADSCKQEHESGVSLLANAHLRQQQEDRRRV